MKVVAPTSIVILALASLALAFVVGSQARASLDIEHTVMHAHVVDHHHHDDRSISTEGSAGDTSHAHAADGGQPAGLTPAPASLLSAIRPVSPDVRPGTSWSSVYPDGPLRPPRSPA